jgi:hypothetical protein
MITRRLSAASKARHLPTCSHDKDTIATIKSQVQSKRTQHFLFVFIGFAEINPYKPTKTQSIPQYAIAAKFLYHPGLTRKIFGNKIAVAMA